MPAPHNEVYAVLVLQFAELKVNSLPALNSSCVPADSVVWKSIFRLERTLPCWGSVEVFY